MIRVAIIHRAGAQRVRLAELLSAHPDLRVVWSAPPRPGSWQQMAPLAIDVVLLEIGEDDAKGRALLEEAGGSGREVPVVVFSAEEGARRDVAALSRSSRASGYVLRPATLSELEHVVRERLVPLLLAVGRGAARERLATATAAPPRLRVARPSIPERQGWTGRAKAVVLGCSTGGPDALMELLPSLPPNLGVPVLAVQHMPARFTTLFAARLDQACGLRVHEATQGQLVEPGHVYLAPGGLHMRVRRAGTGVRIALGSDPPVNSCRPSVDELFGSAVEVWGSDLCGVILTGMGTDGLRGSSVMVDAGGCVLAQDEATSVVWGMPGVVVEAGLAHEVLPVDRLHAAVLRAVLGAPSVGRVVAS